MSPLEAQIVDDSTQVVYGPHTTQLFYAQDILELRQNTRAIDTLLVAAPRQDIPHLSPLEYTHLGTLGTAIAPLVETFPTSVHTVIGRPAYVPYDVPAKRLPHFNSRSPYLQVNVLLGQRRRSFLDIDLTRNITPRFNFAIGIHRRTAETPIGLNLSRSPLGVDAGQYHAQTSYFSPDSSYVLLAAFSTLTHRVLETGGSLLNPDDPPALRFNYTQSTQALSSSASKNGFVSAYALQRFAIPSLRPLTYLYLETAFEQTRHTFDEFLTEEDRPFYTNFLASTQNSSTHSQMRNVSAEVGVLHASRTARTLSHRFYVRNYYYEYVHHFLTIDPKPLYVRQVWEISPGYALTHEWTPEHRLDLLGTFRIQSLDFNHLARSRAYYLLHLKMRVPYVGFSLDAAAYEKRAQYHYHLGNHFGWSPPNLGSPLTGTGLGLAPENPAAHRTRFLVHGTYAYDGTRKRFGIRITPQLGASWRFEDVVFGAQRIPIRVQNTGLGRGDLQLTLGLFNHRLRLRMHWLSQLPWGQNQHTWALPQHQALAQLAYQDTWFDGELGVYMLVWAHWRDAYFPTAFEPAIGQFYLQNDFGVSSYVTLNAAVTIQIRKFTGYVRALHLNQGQGRSYFTIPYYLGEQRSFDFGFKWQFFN